MDRNQPSANLLDREGRIIAEILERFRNVMLVATQRVSNKSNPGQSAFNSMQMSLEAQGLIKSCEELLTLTRQLRELWVVGPLRKAGEGEAEATASIDTSVEHVVGVLNALRQRTRQELMGPHGTYNSEEVASGGPAQVPAAGAAVGNAQVGVDEAGPDGISEFIADFNGILRGGHISEASGDSTEGDQAMLCTTSVFRAIHDGANDDETPAAEDNPIKDEKEDNDENDGEALAVDDKQTGNDDEENIDDDSDFEFEDEDHFDRVFAESTTHKYLTEHGFTLSQMAPDETQDQGHEEVDDQDDTDDDQDDVDDREDSEDSD